jgi:hypothetical protein
MRYVAAQAPGADIVRPTAPHPFISSFQSRPRCLRVETGIGFRSTHTDSGFARHEAAGTPE